MGDDKKNEGKADDIVNFAKSKLKDIKSGIDNASDKAKDAINDEDSSMKKTGDNIGSAAKSAGSTIAGFAKRLGKKTSKIAKIAAIKTDIVNLSGQRKTKITELGEVFLLVYRSDFEDESNSSKIIDIIKEIDEMEVKISQKEDEIKQIQHEENLTDEDIKNIKE